MTLTSPVISDNAAYQPVVDRLLAADVDSRNRIDAGVVPCSVLTDACTHCDELAGHITVALSACSSWRFTEDADWTQTHEHDLCEPCAREVIETADGYVWSVDVEVRPHVAFEQSQAVAA